MPNEELTGGRSRYSCRMFVRGMCMVCSWAHRRVRFEVSLELVYVGNYGAGAALPATALPELINRG